MDEIRADLSSALRVLIVFGLDVTTDLGTATGVLYFVPLSLCVATLRPNFPVVVSGACVALIGAGYVLSSAAPTEEFHRIAQLNRSLSAAVVIALGVAGRWFIMTRVRLETQEWIKAGHTELSTQMRGEQELGELLRGILSFLANYVDARVGSIYVGGSGVALTRKGVYGLALPGEETDEADETNEALVGAFARLEAGARSRT